MPFPVYKKRREIAVIGVESTPGTVATKKYAFPWLEKGIHPIISMLENESALGLDTRVNDSAADVGHAEGPLAGKVNENNLFYLLPAMFSKVTTVDNEDGTYTHTFERDPAVARKTLSIWDVRPAGTRLYKSAYLDNLGIKIEVGDQGAYLEASTSIKSWLHEDVASFTPPAFEVGEKEFVSRQVRVYLADDEDGLSNAAALVKTKSIDWSAEETVTVEHYVGEVNNDPEFSSAPAETKASLVARYRSTDFEQGYFANKVHAMKIVAENDDTKIEIIGTRVRFRELTDSDGRDDEVTQTISAFFESDLANGGKDVVVKVTNSIASFS